MATPALDIKINIKASDMDDDYLVDLIYIYIDIYPIFNDREN